MSCRACFLARLRLELLARDLALTSGSPGSRRSIGVAWKRRVYASYQASCHRGQVCDKPISNSRLSSSSGSQLANWARRSSVRSISQRWQNAWIALMSVSRLPSVFPSALTLRFPFLVGGIYVSESFHIVFLELILVQFVAKGNEHPHYLLHDIRELACRCRFRDLDYIVGGVIKCFAAAE